MNSTSTVPDLDDPSTLPPWFIEGEVSLTLHSTLIHFFLMGGYTFAFMTTIYLYLSSKAARPILILGTLTTIYISTSIFFASQWYQMNLDFVQSKDYGTTFENTFFIPDWVGILQDVTENLPVLLADMLLIWRCFHVWNRSYRWILVSSFLAFCESVVFFTLTIYDIATYSDVSSITDTIHNDLFSTYSFISVGTSLLTTSLIAWRIYSMERLTGFSQRKFKYVLDIIVQSSAVYTIAIMVGGIYDIIPLSDALDEILLEDRFVFYSGSICTILISLMPTFMVARIALLSQRDTTVISGSQITGINFVVRSNDQLGNDGEKE